MKKYFIFVFENNGILFLFEKWICMGCLFIFKKRKYGILVVYFCYKWYCMVCQLKIKFDYLIFLDCDFFLFFNDFNFGIM